MSMVPNVDYCVPSSEVNELVLMRVFAPYFMEGSDQQRFTAELLFDTNEKRVRFYSLGMQAIYGDNSSSKPTGWDMKIYEKWDYWNNLKGMS